MLCLGSVNVTVTVKVAFMGQAGREVTPMAHL